MPSPLMQKDLNKKYSFNRKPSYGMEPSNYGNQPQSQFEVGGLRNQ